MSRPEWSVVLPRRVIPQPTPGIVAGGDCGACVLGGTLGIAIERVYDELREKRDSIHFSEMTRLLRVAVSRGLAAAVVDEPAIWLPYNASSGQYAFGLQARDCAIAWFNCVRMALDGGYYGIAHVDHGRDVASKRGRETNHWVAIVGARERFVPHPTMAGCGSYEQEVLVSCSARSTPAEEWVDRNDFIRERGGLDVLFARPA